ncbi:NADPH:quinone oxidoreductase family protein [Yinghuangia aomiensis]|uniref:NADPH:quinone oxidoreductase family protein n=1 Tax=Yinghuangia aomiensis TaxID=676205 RepID=A0ABP9I495_9ACTN
MRAWRVSGHGEPGDVLGLAEVELPEPGPGQIRMRVAAAGIGLPDVLMCRGSYPLTPAVPFTPGQEAVGVVTAVAEGVDIAVGAEVMAVTAFPTGHGAFAEECLAYAGSTFARPPGLDDAAAAGFWIPHLTGWLGLVTRGQVAPGEWLVVLGAAGGTGMAAVQLGRALGARVIAVAGGSERTRFCRELGADAVIDHREGPLAPALRELTGGRGVDAIYDPVGGTAAEDAAGALARGGRLLAVGFASGAWAEVPTARLVMANASVVGVYAGGIPRHELDFLHERLCALVAQGKLGGAVGSVRRFEELPDALEQLGGRRVVGKHVLRGCDG